MTDSRHSMTSRPRFSYHVDVAQWVQILVSDLFNDMSISQC